jgi:uncharacterized membrane protein
MLVWGAVLLGVGAAGTLDEVVFHQLLRWHHFYGGSDSVVAVVSDGLFHLVSTGAIVIGGILLWRATRFGRLDGRRVWGSILAGAGAFNLYDGTIQHKVLRLHQVREGVGDDTPYDLVFIGLAVLTFAAGLALARRAAVPSRSPDPQGRMGMPAHHDVVFDQDANER